MLERIHFQILDALCRNASLTKAAQELHLTQSALTHRIKKLEQLAGVVLWEKDGKNLRLTQAGNYLKETARWLEPQFREAEAALVAFGEGSRGKLRIGIECHPCYEVLLTFIREFLERWKQIDLDITRNFSFNAYQALIEHQVDAIITPDRLDYDGLEYHPVRDYELFLAVSPDHPLAAKDFAQPGDLRDQVLFTYPIKRERLDVFTGFLIPAGIQPRRHETVEDTEIMLQLVHTGRGVSTFPDWVLENHAADYPLKGIHLGRNGIRKKLYLVARTDPSRPAFLSDFISLSSHS
ncbi:MAG: LysR family transcriptional regulator [Spirochaetales bacterium]|nr:LysR family transcriptional regulator [Spirochaetales bacterium]